MDIIALCKFGLRGNGMVEDCGACYHFCTFLYYASNYDDIMTLSNE